ncbi:hypothetical protein UG55_110017 [Frankia sp. EI5c]|uniref:hypothetical protein n=1 Tax=Frankia sp. EI5c TaxID=683316 RepID=UPI0007C2B85F|nr:hypothetical protein [Frankia sp. EI5c]OAA18765.1 hypothetical protein UG55_110017 [Frankia sp. EI5c]
MVELRSGRQDRALLLIVWGLTVVVLVLGALTLSPILLVWGVIGLPAAVLLSYVHLRDTRRSATAAGGRPAAGDTPDGQRGPGGAGKAGAIEDAVDDGIEEESSR